MAKWLEQQLKPFLDDKYSVESSATFVEDLQRLQPEDTDVCVSYDIKSLYTNVPLSEVLDDIADTVYAPNPKATMFQDSTITKRVFKQMMRKCSESIFLYRNKVY